MSVGNSSIVFQQRCPVCGRALQVPVVLLGRRVYCQHCGGGFVAMDATMQLRSPSRAAAGVPLEVVDALLARATATLEAVTCGGTGGVNREEDGGP